MTVIGGITVVNMPTEQQTSRVFLSYSGKDAPKAEAVRDVLMNDRSTWTKGWTVFSYKHSPSLGADYERELLRMARTFGVVVLLWSGRSETSRWVKREFIEGGDARRFVVPVLLDDTPLPRGLADKHAIRAYRRPQRTWIPELVEHLRWLADHAREHEGLTDSRNGFPIVNMIEEIARWARRRLL